MSVHERMTAIADRLRTLIGVPGALGLYEMSDYLDAAIRASDTQADLIGQIKGAIGENVSKTANSVSEQSTVIHQLRDAIAENATKTTNEVSEQTTLIQQLKGAIGENVSKTSSEVSEQAAIINQIKAALIEKGYATR